MDTRHRISALDERIRVLEERRDRLKKAEAERERKRDTRRKILLGARLVALVRDGDEQAKAVYARACADLSDRERRVFEGWEP